MAGHGPHLSSQLCREAQIRRIAVKADLVINWDPISKITKAKRTDRVAKVESIYPASVRP
jgi:hypothetical protein